MSRPFLDTTTDDLAKSFHFNVLAPFELCKLAVPHILERGGGSIINIGSVAGQKATRGSFTHSLTKSALGQLTRLMAVELAPRIRVNAVLPGAVETDALRWWLTSLPEETRQAMIDKTMMRRNGQPDDISPAVLYLVSPAASWVTGKLIEVDGAAAPDLVPNTQPGLCERPARRTACSSQSRRGGNRRWRCSTPIWSSTISSGSSTAGAAARGRSCRPQPRSSRQRPSARRSCTSRYASAHFDEYWAYGAFFVAVAWFQLAAAAGILLRPSRGVLVAAGLLNAGVALRVARFADGRRRHRPERDHQPVGRLPGRARHRVRGDRRGRRARVPVGTCAAARAVLGRGRRWESSRRCVVAMAAATAYAMTPRFTSSTHTTVRVVSTPAPKANPTGSAATGTGVGQAHNPSELSEQLPYIAADGRRAGDAGAAARRRAGRDTALPDLRLRRWRAGSSPPAGSRRAPART